MEGRTIIGQCDRMREAQIGEDAINLTADYFREENFMGDSSGETWTGRINYTAWGGAAVTFLRVPEWKAFHKGEWPTAPNEEEEGGEDIQVAADNTYILGQGCHCPCRWRTFTWGRVGYELQVNGAELDEGPYPAWFDVGTVKLRVVIEWEETRRVSRLVEGETIYEVVTERGKFAKLLTIRFDPYMLDWFDTTGRNPFAAPCHQSDAAHEPDDTFPLIYIDTFYVPEYAEEPGYDVSNGGEEPGRVDVDELLYEGTSAFLVPVKMRPCQDVQNYSVQNFDEGMDASEEYYIQQSQSVAVDFGLPSTGGEEDAGGLTAEGLTTGELRFGKLKVGKLETGHLEAHHLTNPNNPKGGLVTGNFH